MSIFVVSLAHFPSRAFNPLREKARVAATAAASAARKGFPGAVGEEGPSVVPPLSLKEEASECI